VQGTHSAANQVTKPFKKQASDNGRGDDYFPTSRIYVLGNVHMRPSLMIQPKDQIYSHLSDARYQLQTILRNVWRTILPEIAGGYVGDVTTTQTIKGALCDAVLTSPRRVLILK
jgi:hypothetical protein